MGSLNICLLFFFCGEIRKNIDSFWLKKKVPYLELCFTVYVYPEDHFCQGTNVNFLYHCQSKRCF